MEPSDLVQLLASDSRLEAMRALVGGINARDLRDVRVPDGVFNALVAGLDDSNSQIRWWCLQLLDHIEDERAIVAIVGSLDDPVARVRRNAAHALGCQGCKPSWDGELPPEALDRLTNMAELDDNAKVRVQAAATLACARRTLSAPRDK